MSTLGGLLLGLILAFPVTWALQGVYSVVGGERMDPTAVNATDMRLIIVIVLLAMNLFREGRRPPSPPSRRPAP